MKKRYVDRRRGMRALGALYTIGLYTIGSRPWDYHLCICFQNMDKCNKRSQNHGEIWAV